MDIIILVLLIFVSLILMYLIFKSNSASGSIEANDLMNFSNSLNSQIQDIRKEVPSGAPCDFPHALTANHRANCHMSFGRYS